MIEVERWKASVASAPGETEPTEVRAEVDARSLRVLEGTGGIKPLSDSDRDEIRGNLEQKILRSDRHPDITFVSSTVRALDERRWQVDGELTLAGASAPIQIPVQVESLPDGTRLSATVTITQSRFGIKPYTAMMGALKVADDVEIRFQATAQPAQGDH